MTLNHVPYSPKPRPPPPPQVCFIVSSLNGYTATMLQAMAAPSVKGDQPQTNQNVGAFFWHVP